jgi:hypothetical protein
LPRIPWKRVESPPGAGGTIDIPLIGAHVGDIGRWTLRRRNPEDGATGPDAEMMNLEAFCTWINTVLWEDEDYTKVVVLDHGRIQKRYRIDQQPGFGSRLSGRVLIMEGVVPCLLDQ